MPLIILSNGMTARALQEVLEEKGDSTCGAEDIVYEITACVNGMLDVFERWQPKSKDDREPA